MKIEWLQDFLKDENIHEAFITGPAGSGKTTLLKQIVKQVPNCIVTAYTHKACEVLQNKLPKSTKIITLHKFLKKIPDINEKAKKLEHLQINKKIGEVKERPKLLIVDEFSFINEQDYTDLCQLWDPIALERWQCIKCRTINEDLYCENCGNGNADNFIDVSLSPIKILYVGDLNQLPPVKGFAAIQPYEPYWLKLTKVHRNNFPQLQDLINMIEDKIKPFYLKPSGNFQRPPKGKIWDIDKMYLEDNEPNKIMLAYTNEAVQKHNAKIQGRDYPQVGDILFNNTWKLPMEILDIYDEYEGELITHTKPINMQTKYNPIKYLNKIKEIRFYKTPIGVIPGIFGVYTNKIIREDIAKKLIDANRKNSSKAKEYYRTYKLLNDYVSIFDFNHCYTVHKSQGSQYKHVYIDTYDFKKCKNTEEKLKLLYVGMSRAIEKIILNF